MPLDDTQSQQKTQETNETCSHNWETVSLSVSPFVIEVKVACSVCGEKAMTLHPGFGGWGDFEDED